MVRSFEFSAGALSLDFLDTVSRRDADPVELLRSPADLERWMHAAGLDSGAKIGPAELAAATCLRGAIEGAFFALLEGRDLPASAVAEINRIAARPDLRPQLIDGQITLKAERTVEAALSRIAADAIENLAPERRARLRVCPDCRMLFRDNSRPGRRKWCSSSSGCGNRAKVRRHRANRKKATAHG